MLCGLQWYNTHTKLWQNWSNGSKRKDSQGDVQHCEDISQFSSLKNENMLKIQYYKKESQHCNLVT
jgi:hypothetical protein